eukprot:4240058-Prorocentrum_lima.AAC.1
MTSSLVGLGDVYKRQAQNAHRVVCARAFGKGGHPLCLSNRSFVLRPLAAVSYTHLTLPTICSV